MPNYFVLGKTKLSRRQMLKFGIAGVGLTAASVALQNSIQGESPVRVPPQPSSEKFNGASANPTLFVCLCLTCVQAGARIERISGI